MIQSRRSPLTGLPQITEDRKTGVPFHALPRQYWDFARNPEKKAQAWIGEWMTWQGQTLQRVRCWKCGNDIKGWRLALDATQQPIRVDGQPAVTFGLLDTFRQSRMQAYLATLDEVVTFTVLHCADCVIQDGDAMEALTCYLQGLDAQLQQAWRYRQGTQVTRHQWASHLYLWHNAEPIGLAEDTMDATLTSINAQLVQAKRDAKGAITLPTPGELLTAAHYVHDVLGWSLVGVKTGMMMRYTGPAWAGWLPADGRTLDPLEYPALAKLMPTLPNEPGWVVKL